MTQNVGIVIVEYEIKEIDRGVNGERGRTMDTHVKEKVYTRDIYFRD